MYYTLYCNRHTARCPMAGTRPITMATSTLFTARPGPVPPLGSGEIHLWRAWPLLALLLSPLLPPLRRPVGAASLPRAAPPPHATTCHCRCWPPTIALRLGLLLGRHCCLPSARRHPLPPPPAPTADARCTRLQRGTTRRDTRYHASSSRAHARRWFVSCSFIPFALPTATPHLSWDDEPQLDVHSRGRWRHGWLVHRAGSLVAGGRAVGRPRHGGGQGR